MPKFDIKVTYHYSVDAKNAKDGLATIPHTISFKYGSILGSGTAEIADAAGKVVLTAKLVRRNNGLPSTRVGN